MPGSRVGWWTLLAVHSATFLLGLGWLRLVGVDWGWLGSMRRRSKVGMVERLVS